MASIYALVVAAGQGNRFGSSLPKQYLPLGGASILRHAVAAFADHPRLTGTLVTIRSDDRNLFDGVVAGLGVVAFYAYVWGYTPLKRRSADLPLISNVFALASGCNDDATVGA